MRRPNDYNAAAAASLGPNLPSPALNLAAIGHFPGSAPPAAAAAAGLVPLPEGAEREGRHLGDLSRIFVGGLPPYLNDEQAKELAASFGEVKYLELMRDRESGASKG